MSKTMVCQVLSKLLDIFEDFLGPKWIKLEKTLEEENESKEIFFRTAGMPGVVGCVDGTHVRIKAPGNQRNHLYYNRKGYYSINVMLICDHNMVITYVNARHPGANHDSFVWDQSAADHFFKTNYLHGKRNTWLLGDSGYKLQPYLMTTYRNPTETHQKKFYEKHCKIRNIIERCNGVLTNRFRCIIGSITALKKPQKSSMHVACCILHNICIFYKNNWELDVTENSEPLNSNNAHNYVNTETFSEEAELAKSIRDEISRNLI